MGCSPGYYSISDDVSGAIAEAAFSPISISTGGDYRKMVLEGGRDLHQERAEKGAPKSAGCAGVGIGPVIAKSAPMAQTACGPTLN